jgi:hypothetical protein
MEKNRALKMLEQALVQYGFIMAPSEIANSIVEVLRENNLIHYFRISKVNEYLILELNTTPCEHECNAHCYRYDGYKDEYCHLKCVYECKEEKMNLILTKIRVY